MGRDVQPFQFTGTIAPLKRLFRILDRELFLSVIRIYLPHPGVGDGEVGIQLDCALIKRNRAELVPLVPFRLAQAECLERL